MQTVTLKGLQHRHTECIGIYFSRSDQLQQAIRKIAGVKWSQSNKCWYLPLNRDNYNKIAGALSEIAMINHDELRHYMQQQKAIIHTALSYTTEKKHLPPVTLLKKKGLGAIRIAEVNAHVLPDMEQMLQLKAYSNTTIKTYLGEMSRLLVLLKNKAADELTSADIKRYLLFCYEKLRLTENTLHSRMNALKFYYEQVLHNEKIFWEIPRPKKQLQNPHFFNQDEITKILKQTANIKHKTMLMLAYSTGMRVSEVTHLKVWQIDSKRMQILVQQAKGKKDRVTALSPVLLVMLREYFRKYQPQKEGYLFYGQNRGEPYSSRSLQNILQQAKKKAGILKPGSIHALRHSFATHLLDKGTDVTMIMKLLGHNDLKTTLRYLHVTNRDVLQIISPLDQLDLG